VEGWVLDVMVGFPGTVFYKELIIEALGEGGKALWVAMGFLAFTWVGTTKIRLRVVLSQLDFMLNYTDESISNF